MHQFLQLIYFYCHIFGASKQYYTFQCSSCDTTIEGDTFSHSLSTKYNNFAQKSNRAVQTQQLNIVYAIYSKESQDNSSQKFSDKSSNNKCNTSDAEHKNYSTHLQCIENSSHYGNKGNDDNENYQSRDNNDEDSNGDEDFNSINFLFLLQLLVLLLSHSWNTLIIYQLFLKIVGCHTCHDVELLLSNVLYISSNKRCQLIEMRIDRKRYYPIFKLKSPFPFRAYLQYLPDKSKQIRRSMHYKLLTYSDHSPLQGWNFSMVYRQATAIINTNNVRLYLRIPKEQGMILLQKHFYMILFNRDFRPKFTGYYLVKFQARNTTIEFHDMNRTKHHIYNLMSDNVIRRIPFYRTHHIFHIENYLTKLSILEMLALRVQQLSNFSLQNDSILCHSIVDYFYWNRYLCNELTFTHVITLRNISGLVNDYTTGNCLQESSVDVPVSQNTLLCFTHTIQGPVREGSVDAFRSIDIVTGCTIVYYSKESIEHDDSWQLVVGHTILYDASRNQILHNPGGENHEMVHGNNINALVNFAIENPVPYVPAPPVPEVDHNNDLNMIVSLLLLLLLALYLTAFYPVLKLDVEENVEVFIYQLHPPLDSSCTYLKMVEPFAALLGTGGNTVSILSFMIIALAIYYLLQDTGFQYNEVANVPLLCYLIQVQLLVLYELFVIAVNVLYRQLEGAIMEQ